MNILITGNAGLLGSRFADWILDNTNHHVIGIDDLSGGYIENVNSAVEFHKLNLYSDDIEFIQRAISSPVVLHGTDESVKCFTPG